MKWFWLVLFCPGLLGCGDRCVVLCREVAAQLDSCRSSAMSWEDLGARGKADFIEQCRREWDHERPDLSASHLALSLEACGDANKEIDDLTCDEVMALYGPED